MIYSVPIVSISPAKLPAKSPAKSPAVSLVPEHTEQLQLFQISLRPAQDAPKALCEQAAKWVSKTIDHKMKVSKKLLVFSSH